MKKTVPVLLLALMLSACLKKELGTGMTDAESQEVIVLLEEQGLRASRQPDVVESGQQQAERKKIQISKLNFHFRF